MSFFFFFNKFYLDKRKRKKIEFLQDQKKALKKAIQRNEIKPPKQVLK